MVADLRKKFVVVTTTLMFVIFGSFLLVNHIYNSYWNKADTADMLDLIAECGYFLYDDAEVEQTIRHITEGVSPIAGIIVDEEGSILSTRIIGDSGKINIRETVIQKILEADDQTYQMERYLFSKMELDDGRTLIVLMDTTVDDDIWKKGIVSVLMVLAGVAILILITFYLSKFVTEPAQKALNREKRFISDASHELKTPLGAISINAQAALKVSEPDNAYIRNIVTESERMERLIERLLTLSKLEEGESPKSRIPLSEIVTEMALTYESVAYEKGLSYGYHIEEDLFIQGNDDEIRQLMAILIDNAIKNTKENDPVEINCEKKDCEAYIEVKNAGKGIRSEDLPYVFDRFYTSDTSRSNKSFGLGLSIAKTIVRTHHGRLTVDSIPNEVTTFTAAFKTVS